MFFLALEKFYKEKHPSWLKKVPLAKSGEKIGCHAEQWCSVQVF